MLLGLAFLRESEYILLSWYRHRWEDGADCAGGYRFCGVLSKFWS
jgi:hypothetical protein